ncbi:MAG: SpoIIE family protein phosphatase, partial [Oscillospiraceae bacterium]|nr:SpoIIE family protein phosphatase [Oscillospiraceae bacterium]
RRQYQSRVRESREAVCRQYAVFARSLDEAARRLAQEPERDLEREKAIRQRLYVLGLEGEAAVWRDRGGHFVVEITGKNLGALQKEEEREALSSIAGVPLRQAQVIPGGLHWRQAETLMAVAGVAARKKDGQTVSGDAGAWFKTEEGSLFVLLCDGMGSGPEAHRESTLAIGLLERFLRSGIEPEEALNTLNAALALRCEEEGGFTTIDLFRLNLYTGEAGFYKLGAAPTYIRRQSGVSRITGSSLPAGLSTGEGSGPDVSRLRLEAGDSVLMISDGVAAPEEDGWVKTALAAYDGTDPKTLAAGLMDHSAHGPTDDRTAVVLTIQRR